MIKLEQLFSLTFKTDSGEEIKYLAKTSEDTDNDKIDKAFEIGWKKLEDTVFGQVDNYLKGQGK